MIGLIMLGVLLVVVVGFEMRRPVDPMFREVTRRERAMKALSKTYNPESDTVLKRREERREGQR